MKRHLTFVASIILIATVAISCKSLDAIEKFATASEAMLNEYSAIHYSFTGSYYDYTLGRKKLDGEAAADEMEGKKVAPPAVDPGSVLIFNRADVALEYFKNTLTAYLSAISKASSDDLVDYNFDDLADDLKTDSVLKGSLHISDENIEGGAKVAKVLTNKLVNRYRERKLRKVISNHADDFIRGIDGLLFSLNRLQEVMKNDSSMVNSAYVLLAATKVGIDKKVEWRREHIRLVTEISNERRKLTLLIKGLNEIKSAQNDLTIAFRNKSKLTDENVIKLLNGHSARLASIITQINSTL